MSCDIKYTFANSLLLFGFGQPNPWKGQNFNYILRVALTILARSQPVAADEGGIEFGSMAKGYKWYSENSEGTHRVSEFKGKKAGKYIVESHYTSQSGKKTNVAEYDADGLMTRRTWGDGLNSPYFPRRLAASVSAAVRRRSVTACHS